MKDFFKAVRWNLLAVLFTALAFTFTGCETEATASSEPVYYIVSVQDGIQNGTVVVLSSTTCKAGTTVTLQANPDEGYKLSTFIVTDKNDNSVTVTENTFIMPKSDVTVSASFVKDESNSGSEGGESGEGGSQGGETGTGGESGEGGENQGGIGGQGEGGESGGQTGGEGQGTGTEGQGEGQGGGITEGENQGSGTGGETGGEGEGGESGGGTETREQYFVTFKANGGNESQYNIFDYEDTEVTLLENRFTRYGYTFKEWNTKADGTGTGYQPGAKYTIKDDHINLYAIWEPATDTPYLVYHYLQPENGSETTFFYDFDSSEIKKGTTGELTKAEPKEIPGFYPLENIQQETIADPKKNPAAEGYEPETTVTIYYNRNKHTLSFDANADGDKITVPEAINTRFGAKEDVTLDITSRPTHTFAGWNTKKDGSGTKLELNNWLITDFTMPDEDVVLYAQWTPITTGIEITQGTNEYTIDCYHESKYSSDYVLSVKTKLNLPASAFIWEIDNKAASDYEWVTVGTAGTEDEGKITVNTSTWKKDAEHIIEVHSPLNGRIYSSTIHIKK